MYCDHARLCVCLSAAVHPHYCTDPDVTWRRGRGCPLDVHYWADLQSGHGLRCYGNITRTLVPSLRPSRDMTTLCERPAGRGLRALLAGDWVKLRAVYGKWPWLAGRWLAVDGGRSQHCCGSRTAGFHWWHSGNIMRTQNVSEYMLVLALCLVRLCRPIILCHQLIAHRQLSRLILRDDY